MAHRIALSLNNSLLLDVSCALVVHKIYNKYEVEPANLLATLILLVGIPSLPCYFLLAHFDSGVLAGLLSYAAFYGTLASSIILYRLSPIHPLAKYPGPWYLKISKLFAMLHASSGKQYVFFRKLHDKYGSFVRVGPNEVSVADVEAIRPILGLDGMRRGPLWIAHNKPGMTPSIAALRSVGLHDERRKLWNRGFTTAALKGLQIAVQDRVLELVDELNKRVSPRSEEKGASLDLAHWLSSFAYDIMGDMVFGGGFSLMRKGDENGVRSVFNDYVKVVGVIEHISWIVGLVHKSATVPEKQLRFQEFVVQRYEMRKNQGATKRDLFHYITNEDKMEVPRDQGINDVLVAIGAGADTTSTALGGLFFYLLSNPSVFYRLRKEVDSEFPVGEGEPFDAVKLASLPYLNAVINETLRLQPAVPTSLQRCPLEGSGGKMVAVRFVPESTALYVPPYILHRDSRYFSPFPDSFIPERWLDADGEKFTTNTAAFIPFSTGPANCVGKNLALLEMRMAVATIVQRFDMKFASGYDPCKWEEDLQDFYIYRIGKLPIVLYARE
ncbi:hypothetical protein ACEPAI_4670 [Sanghuangporus weigelae]